MCIGRHIAVWLLSVFVMVGGITAAVRADEQMPPAPEGSFSIVVIPDTQQYTGLGTKARKKGSDKGASTTVANASFAADTRWIADNLERQRIVFVSHVGDIVDINERRQWEVARQCMDVLHGRVPYGISVGNHDMTSAGDSSLFQKYFPASRFAGMPWYGGAYQGNATPGQSGDNADSFQLFSAGGMDFVFLHLECNAPDDVLQWADGVLDAHAQRRALVTTHMGLGPLLKPKTNAGYFDDPRGRMQWKKCHGRRGNTPQQMWDKCFRKHANLFAVISGDQSRTEAMRQASRNDAGRVVYEIMSDYNDGWLRVYRFLPQDNRIECRTVFSRTGALCTGTKFVPDPAEHQFTLEYEMTERGGKR